MHAMAKLAEVETKLFVREPMALFWGLFFPVALVTALGAFFPGFLDPTPDLAGARPIDVYGPIVLGLGLATVALTTLPSILATYRQLGVLRRMRTTPVHPAWLLGAQLGVHVGVAATAAILTVSVGVLAFDMAAPGRPVLFTLVFLLAAAAMLGMGLLIGAIARTVSAAQGIGMVVYFPMLFFAGVWFPRDAMSDGLRNVSDLTPTGASVQALQDTWGGAAPRISNLIVMAVFAMVATALAARLFRWE